MAVEQHPRARATDGGRIALAALFLYIIAAAMLLSLNSGDGGEVAEDAPREAFDESADADSSVAAGGVTHFVATADEWQQAVAAAKPGDEIRLTATIRQPLIYEGGDDGEPADGASGTPEAPIVITADEGVWIDPGAFETRGWAGLNIRYVSHVHAVGLQIRNAQFGIRCLQCTGSASSPIRLADNTIESLGFVGIHVAGHLDTHAPSSHVVIEGNSISDTGNLVERFGEGIYLGYGGLEWVDETSNIVVRNNEIAHTSAEGIDIKPGTREIVVEGNRLHHVAPIDGGAISAHYVNGGLNPKLDELDRVLIRDNRIWNHNLDGAPGASDAAVWIGHGGVELIDNKFWGFRIHPNTRSVRIKAKADFGPHPITIVDNTFWTERGWVAEGDYDPKAIVASGNIGPEATGIELPVTIDAFIGPVPPIGEGGDADNGGGPGSGLELARGSSATAPSPPPAQPQAPEPPPSTQPPAPELPATAAPDAAPPAAAPPAQLPATAAPEAAPPAAKPQPNKPPTAKPEPNKPPPASKRPSRASDAAAAAALSGTAGTEPPAAGVAATPADTPVAASGPAQANNPTNDAGGGPAAATTPVAQTTAVATTPASRAVDTLPAVPAPDSAGASDPQQAAGGTAVAAASQSETPNQTNDPVFDNGPGWDPSAIQPSRRAIDTEPGLAISGDEETAQLPTPTATTTTNSTDEEAWSGRAKRSAATLVIILATATLVVPSLQRRILRGR